MSGFLASPGTAWSCSHGWLVRKGLRTLLVTFLMIASSFYIGGVIVHEKSLTQFYGALEGHAANADLDAPHFVLFHGRSPINVSNATTLQDTITNANGVNSTGSNISTHSFAITPRTDKVYNNPGIDDTQKDNVGRGAGLTELDDKSGDHNDESMESALDETNEIGDDEEEEEEKNGNNVTTKMTTFNASIARPWASSFHLPIRSIHNRTLTPFEKQDRVVIVTKIHGPHQLNLLEQSLCLLHFAYNRRPCYDILVFTTEEVPEESMELIRNLVSPAKLTFVVDNRGLQEEIKALSKPRYDAFLKSCNVDHPFNLTWWSQCPGRIAYNWQAEFRAWHMWRHPALKEYSWMMWLDADAFCTKEWTVDPIQAMIENDLVILFDNWPKGSHSGQDVQNRINEAFGVYLCTLRRKNGHFFSKLRDSPCKGSRAGDIHGFFHITNIDFYRSDIVQKWAKIWIGDGFLQRRYDDQAAVTIPVAVLAPERAWEMRRNNIQLDVFHNFDLDGKKKNRVGGFKKYWQTTVQNQLPDAAKVCQIRAGN